MKSLALAAIGMLSFFASPHSYGGLSAPEHLRCEWLVAPTAVGVATPRFSWEVNDSRRGAIQSAYELHVATTAQGSVSTNPDVWSSGKIASNETANVAYAGPALRSGARYYWSVRTWDGKGEASSWAPATSFSMGLLNAGDWKAKWIGDATPLPESEQIPARNGYHSDFADKAQTTKWVAIDLGQLRNVDGAVLWPSRPHDFSPDTPGFGFPVRYRIIGSSDASFANPEILIDRTGEPAPQATEAVRLTFPAKDVRHIKLEVTELRKSSDRGYTFTLAELQVLSGKEVVSIRGKVTAADSIEHNDWSTVNLTDNDLTSHRGQQWKALTPPMMRKDFNVASDVTRATLYITALGVYEARINGKRVGDHQLSPEWTDYHSRVQYQAYDVTKLLSTGANAIGVYLGDGWYSGRIGMAQQFTDNKRARAVYGRQPRLIAQLHIQHANGAENIVTTDETWTTTINGPIRTSDMLDGEVYDARKEMPGFDKPGFSGADWTPAVVDDTVRTQLVPQPNEPIRIIDTIKPIALTQPRPGVYVFDLGQNMPGWCRIHVKGKAGATLKLRHVEALNDDGTVYTANLRGAPQIDSYTLAGRGVETWEPRFIYHGFRFVEWTGDVEPPTIESLEGIVVTTDAPMAGTFASSHPLLNQLWSNILWTQHANTMSVPTDCPQRDERLGWMGDILAFGQTASFNKDLAAFYNKWLLDVRDAQADDGRFPDIAPHPFGKNERFSGAPAWGDAGVFVPWCAYQNYADTRLLTDHFEAMRRWVDWVHSKNPELVWRNARFNDYNDWLNGDTLISEGWPRKGGEVPRDVFATAFFAQSTWMVAQMADAIGRKDDAKRYTELHSRIKQVFNKEFVGPDAKMPGDTQAGYALALGFNLLPDDRRDDAVAHLVRGINAYKDHLSTGFHSTHHAMIELTRAGHADLAYKLATNTTFPSWGYSIENGSTTIWERWDGYVKGRGFQDPGMNSLNHWALGSVGEWMMRTVIGINPHPVVPGWSQFELRPIPGGGLKNAEGSFHTCRGVVESSWHIDGATTVYKFTVPANTSASVWLPAVDVANITEGGKQLAQVEGVKDAKTDGKNVTFTLGAGSYEFHVTH